MDAVGEVGEREDEGEAQDDQQELRDERDHGDDDRDPVERGTADEAQQGDPEHDEDGGDDVPRVVRQALPADSVAEVVRGEERCERDHDRVVEEQHPAGEETDRVVEGAPG